MMGWKLQLTEVSLSNCRTPLYNILIFSFNLTKFTSEERLSNSLEELEELLTNHVFVIYMVTFLPK